MTDSPWSEMGLIDNVRSVYLDDAGAPGYQAASMVAPNGQEYLIIASVKGIGTERCWLGCDVAHEQLGPLPPDIAARLARDGGVS